MIMVSYPVIRAICLRCGAVNEFDIGLTNKDTNADYRCGSCKFIVITSWMVEKDE